MLRAFQQFFREQADAWLERFDYKEAGPQLLMQAFLQRIVNGGGRISREYGLGRKRTDLFIEWPTDPARGFHGPMQRIVIELKLQRGTLEGVISQGLVQTVAYASQGTRPVGHVYPLLTPRWHSLRRPGCAAPSDRAAVRGDGWWDGSWMRSSAYSGARLPLIPRQACHPFQGKAATDSTARLPPRQRR
ncbi:hypothetical protein [Ectothiorhodospira haloalkaliphila]|uniref:hypothetical protein n=1 Tax=Ectothiorhodospira haloalkaliphila TaxID=421628 RepID=UPI00047E960B|nr:hypothetical protein [Ectothiorhodospira haloalkaliphila]